MAKDFDYLEARFSSVSLLEKQEIPAGTMIVVPDFSNSLAEIENPHPFQPEYTLIMCGQRLSREMYPELSELFTTTGGFYEFVLPDLERKFLLAFDADGTPLMGSGAIFYKSVPLTEEPYAEIRDAINRH